MPPDPKETHGSEASCNVTDRPVAEVLDHATGPRRAEADELFTILEEISGEQTGRLGWTDHRVRRVRIRLREGHGGRAPLLVFAPGPTKHTIYLVNDFSDRWPDLMKRLGKHRPSKACVYLTRLTGLDRSALRELLERSLAGPQVPRAER